MGSREYYVHVDQLQDVSKQNTKDELLKHIKYLNQKLQEKEMQHSNIICKKYQFFAFAKNITSQLFRPYIFSIADMINLKKENIDLRSDLNYVLQILHQ